MSELHQMPVPKDASGPWSYLYAPPPFGQPVLFVPEVGEPYIAKREDVSPMQNVFRLRWKYLPKPTLVGARP